MVGRYILIRRLGAGGHGHVFAAADRVLEREVALKILGRDGSGDDPAPQWQAALAEAQTLARLSNPYVVTVHDVGIDGGFVWVSMEKVEGADLATLLERDSETTIDRLASIFADAARGLEAAHAAGIVHRDIKPSNILVREDGRAQVVDFGLGRSWQHEPSNPESSDSELNASTLGAGTPSFMAPEQHAGLPFGPATDVYGLCATAYAAWTGRPPFQGDDLAKAKAQGLAPDDPQLPRIPNGVSEVVRCGLNPDPDERPNVEALIAAFSTPVVPPRRWLWVAAAGGAAACAVAAYGVLRPDRPVEAAAPPAWCRDAASHEQLWSDSTRSSVREALSLRGDAEKAEVFVSELDARSQAWTKARAEICVPGTAPSQEFRLRAECLDARLEQTQVVVDLIAGTTASDRLDTLPLSGVLLPVDECSDLRALARNPPLPEDPQTRREIIETRVAGRRAVALHSLGRIEPARAALAATRERADSLGYEPLRAKTLFRLAEIQIANRDTEDAEQTLNEAIEAAQAGRDDLVEALGWLSLVSIYQGRQAPQEAERALGFAAATASRVPEPSVVHVRLATARGNLARVRNDLVEAEAAFAEAVEMGERHFGTEAWQIIEPLSFLGIARLDRRRYAEALEAFERGLGLIRKAESPESPAAAAFEELMGVALTELDEGARAREHLERALAIRQKTHPEDHPDIARSHQWLGTLATREGRFEDAIEQQRAAVEIGVRAFGQRHAQLMPARKQLCWTLVEASRFGEARVECTRAVELAEAVEGEDPRYVRESMAMLGRVEHADGNHRAALRRYQESLEFATGIWGAQSELAAFSLVGIGSELLDLKRAKEAVESLESATSTLQRLRPESPRLAHAWFSLARANQELSKPEDARRFAERAEALYRKIDDPDAAGEVATWLDTK